MIRTPVDCRGRATRSTSPRLRGEVDLRAERLRREASRPRGRFHRPGLADAPPYPDSFAPLHRARNPTSPRKRGEVERAACSWPNRLLGDWCRHLIVIALSALVLALVGTPAAAQLRGHGGPVRAIAISPDGKRAISGSFDSSAIRWSLERNSAEQVLRFHDGAVNAVAILPDGRLVTAGEDARIALWSPGGSEPRVLEGHQAP